MGVVKIKKRAQSNLLLVIAIIAFVIVISLAFYKITIPKGKYQPVNVTEEIVETAEVVEKNETTIEKILEIISKHKNETKEIEKENIPVKPDITVTIVTPETELTEERIFSGKEVFISKKVVDRLEEEELVKVQIMFREEYSNENELIDSLFRDIEESEYQIDEYYSNILITYISKNALSKIQKNRNIITISEYHEPGIILKESRTIINADFVNNLGYNGSGISVCLIDSGIDSNHPYLNGRVVAQKCFCEKSDYGLGGCCPNKQKEDENASDDNGHGTHVAGIIASTHSEYKGVSNGVGIVAVKVTNKTGNYKESDLTKAIQWCVDNKDTYNIRVISMSLAGYSEFYSLPSVCDNHFVGKNATNAYNNGIFLAAGSGNDPEFIGTLGLPACASKVVSVGSIQKDETIWPSTTRNKYLDFYAPGGTQDIRTNPPSFTDIVSLYSTRVRDDINLCLRWVNISNFWFCQDDDFDVGEYFIRLQGTSMATPHVSGSAALLQQYYYLKTGNYLNPDQIKEALNETGVPINDTTINKTVPRIDVAAAIASLTTLNVGDTYEGEIRQGQMWRINLGVQSSMKLNTLLTWGTTDVLNLYLEGPTANYSVTGGSYAKNLTIDVTLGTWFIKVYGANVNNYIDFTISTSMVKTEPSEGGSGAGPGGINFTSAKLKFISTCDPSEVSFVMSAEEAEAGDELINISNATTDSMNTFLTALVIPNDKQWITLDLKGPINPAYWGAPDGRCGDSSRVDGTFAQTELARILWDADVKMKFDQFGSGTEQWERDMMQDWIDNVSSSPYWNEIQAQGFNTFPYTKRRSWIHPAVAEAKGNGCTISITNLTLNVSYVWDATALDLSGYGFRQEIVDDLNNRLEGWKERNIKAHRQNITSETIEKINNDAKYADLRRAFTSIVLAQWFKDQPRDKVPFGDIIDSDDIFSLGLNISYNQGYWDQQACQYLYTLTNSPTFTGVNWNRYYYGGVLLSSTPPEITESIDNNTANLMENATKQAYVQQNETYFFSTTKKPQKPDLNSLVVGFNTLAPEANTTINTTVVVWNKGKTAANNFTVYFYDQYTYPNGYTANYDIGTKDVASLAADAIQLHSIQWNTSKLGRHAVYAVVDYNNNVEETNELNNDKSGTINVLTPYPTATITSPSTDIQTLVYNSTTLTGYGTDTQDGYLSNLNWSSNIDGYLGNSSTLTASLSLGSHIITLTATDSDGHTATGTISVGVLASLAPEAKIISPVDGQTIPEGATAYFNGEANDPEDGALTGSSLVWNSSLDGFLSYGTTFNRNDLTVGTHTINFKATDSTNGIDIEQLVIEVKEGKPSLAINLPADKETFFRNTLINFSGTASDPQDGNISGIIKWVSSIDGNIGTGTDFSKVLTYGTHTITASVVDSNNLTASYEINLSIIALINETELIINDSIEKNETIFDNNSLIINRSDIPINYTNISNESFENKTRNTT